MIFFQEPRDFKLKFEVSSCFIENKGEILLLRRVNNKPQGGTWGVPAGKVEKSETSHESITREIREETSIQIKSEEITYFKTLFVRYPTYDFKYHMYSAKIAQKPNVVLEQNSHDEFKWLKPSEALKLNLIPDEDTCIKLYFNLD